MNRGGDTVIDHLVTNGVCYHPYGSHSLAKLMIHQRLVSLLYQVGVDGILLLCGIAGGLMHIDY